MSSPKLRQFLDDFAAEQNRTVYVYSGDRDPERNARAGGARNSFHTRGQAADIIFKDGTKRETVQALYTSSVREEAGVRLLYHGPNAALPEHSHVDLGTGPDMFERPRGSEPRYVPLQPSHVFGPGFDRNGAPMRTSGGSYPVP